MAALTQFFDSIPTESILTAPPCPSVASQMVKSSLALLDVPPTSNVDHETQSNLPPQGRRGSNSRSSCKRDAPMAVASSYPAPTKTHQPTRSQTSSSSSTRNTKSRSSRGSHHTRQPRSQSMDMTLQFRSQLQTHEQHYQDQYQRQRQDQHQHQHQRTPSQAQKESHNASNSLLTPDNRAHSTSRRRSSMGSGRIDRSSQSLRNLDEYLEPSLSLPPLLPPPPTGSPQLVLTTHRHIQKWQSYRSFDGKDLPRPPPPVDTSPETPIQRKFLERRRSCETQPTLPPPPPSSSRHIPITSNGSGRPTITATGNGRHEATNRRDPSSSHFTMLQHRSSSCRDVGAHSYDDSSKPLSTSRNCKSMSTVSSRPKKEKCNSDTSSTATGRRKRNANREKHKSHVVDPLRHSYHVQSHPSSSSSGTHNTAPLRSSDMVLDERLHNTLQRSSSQQKILQMASGLGRNILTSSSARKTYANKQHSPPVTVPTLSRRQYMRKSNSVREVTKPQDKTKFGSSDKGMYHQNPAGSCQGLPPSFSITNIQGSGKILLSKQQNQQQRHSEQWLSQSCRNLSASFSFHDNIVTPPVDADSDDNSILSDDCTPVLKDDLFASPKTPSRRVMQFHRSSSYSDIFVSNRWTVEDRPRGNVENKELRPFKKGQQQQQQQSTHVSLRHPQMSVKDEVECLRMSLSSIVMEGSNHTDIDSDAEKETIEDDGVDGGFRANLHQSMSFSNPEKERNERGVVVADVGAADTWAYRFGHSSMPILTNYLPGGDYRDEDEEDEDDSIICDEFGESY